jgi:formylglycine-generating enzyme required for sulfatase activity
VLVPAGSFMMGSPNDEVDRVEDEVAHRVTISKAFYVQTTELTIGQHRALRPPKEGSPPSDRLQVPRDDLPFTDRNLGEKLDEADAVIAALRRLDARRRYRLPTEAEWEYACRAGTTTPFSTGATIGSAQANFDAERPLTGSPRGLARFRHTPVDAFPPNAWGLYGFHGNVMEPCRDWYGPYDAAPATDPVGPTTGKARVLRGGADRSPARDVRSAARLGIATDMTSVGLRFVVEVTR